MVFHLSMLRPTHPILVFLFVCPTLLMGENIAYVDKAKTSLMRSKANMTERARVSDAEVEKARAPLMRSKANMTERTAKNILVMIVLYLIRPCRLANQHCILGSWSYSLTNSCNYEFIRLIIRFVFKCSQVLCTCKYITYIPLIELFPR